MNIRGLLTVRREKDEFFKSSAYSPLTPEQQEQFDALRYYDPNPDLDLNVTVTPFAQQDTIIMQTSSGDTQTHRRYGSFTFMVDGQEATLTLYAAPHGYFLPFTDANAGVETYGAGRYLEPEALGDGKFHIDFNQAYNPYCAYSPYWSCPIPPAENRLTVAVRAGEMLPEGDWVEKA
jgi:uncharacterized protein